jgi:flagellar biosynthesis protein FlhF
MVNHRRGIPARAAARPRTPSAPPRATMPAQPRSAATTQIEGARQLLDTPAASRAIMFDLSEQMQSIRSMMKDLASEVRHQKTPHIPDELSVYYDSLTTNQVCPELASEIVTTVYRQLRPEHLRQSDFVKDRMMDHIEKMIPTAGAIKRTKSSGPHISALIGPTGVGKTTTIAKLAANLKLREKKRVGLITIDTYRIAAVDQLRKYADIIGSDLRAVSSPDELRAAVAAMQGCEHILIDTAGRSPNDALKLGELKNFLASAAPDEVHIVLSTTCSQDAVELAIERFADVRVDRMVFTKLDEAPHVGVMLNVIRKVNKPLSYLTNGQDVPDDIEVGQGRRLAQLILGSEL